MPRRLVAALAAALVAALAGCSVSAADSGSTELAVTVDTRGDARQTRAMDIADRYAPDGTFSLEQESSTSVSTEGTGSSRSSTTVVFTVERDADAVVEQLRRETHVLDVTRR